VLFGLLGPILRIGHGLDSRLRQDIPLLFLIPVLLASVAAGFVVGVLVSLAAFLARDWFLVPPVTT